MLGFATIFGPCRIELEIVVSDLASATCLQKTGSETGFLAQNLDR